MPRRVVLLILPLLSLVGGCKALVREAETVEYRPGTAPATAVARCDAAFTLYAPEPNTQLAYATIELPKGAIVGFRREPDGSLVALAGEQITPIPDSRAMWRYTPKPVNGLERFAVKTRDKCETVIGIMFLVPWLIIHPVIAGQL